MFLDQFLFELSCKNTETHTHTYTHTHTDAHKHSDEYPIDVLCKNATIIIFAIGIITGLFPGFIEHLNMNSIRASRLISFEFLQNLYNFIFCNV